MSEPWPFSREDWERVSEAARAIVNATMAEDAVLHAACFEELRCVLAALRDQYGDHAVLWETEADFANDPQERRRLYEAAERLALRAGLVTYSIRTALARLLLEEFGDPIAAREKLLACEPELASHADEDERREWGELMAQCAAADSPG
jgi:hypothetical protein